MTAKTLGFVANSIVVRHNSSFDKYFPRRTEFANPLSWQTRFSWRISVTANEAPALEQLETFPNPSPGRDYTIEIVCPEFTSLCPLTGQPDFGTITYRYVPNEKCVELKSLKLYLQRFRNHGIFYEQVTNRLLDDFVAMLKPLRLQVIGAFTPRGGITTTVTCNYQANSPS